MDAETATDTAAGTDALQHLFSSHHERIARVIGRVIHDQFARRKWPSKSS
jgi:hypothetical protein